MLDGTTSTVGANAEPTRWSELFVTLGFQGVRNQIQHLVYLGGNGRYGWETLHTGLRNGESANSQVRKGDAPHL